MAVAACSARCEGSEGDDLALVDGRRPVAEPLCLLHEVGDQHDRHPAVAHAVDQALHLPARFGIEPGRELVQDGGLGLAIKASTMDSRCSWPHDRALQYEPRVASNLSLYRSTAASAGRS